MNCAALFGFDGTEIVVKLMDDRARDDEVDEEMRQK